MIENVIAALALVTALGSGLMAGLFFTFSNFAMRALGKIQPAAGIAAMQSINIVILNPLFFVIFMGTALASIILPILLIVSGQSHNVPLIIGSVSYLLGVMAVTIVFNVPMNNALDAVEPDSAEGKTLWDRYLIDWTNWNHVRTVASTLALFAFILGITS